MHLVNTRQELLFGYKDGFQLHQKQRKVIHLSQYQQFLYYDEQESNARKEH
ncbi:Uncharacterised protein [Bartonella vinsonii]|uniref:Uncharacterized protein n=1 Tax=Bartonella vinsonii TaxID=33047 RepID=A0A3S4Z3A9_BARVI|nr:Uncharacterised protein [Bartonella vinsonii]